MKMTPAAQGVSACHIGRAASTSNRAQAITARAPADRRADQPPQASPARASFSVLLANSPGKKAVLSPGHPSSSAPETQVQSSICSVSELCSSSGSVDKGSTQDRSHRHRLVTGGTLDTAASTAVVADADCDCRSTAHESAGNGFGHPAGASSMGDEARGSTSSEGKAALPESHEDGSGQTRGTKPKLGARRMGKLTKSKGPTTEVCIEAKFKLNRGRKITMVLRDSL